MADYNVTLAKQKEGHDDNGKHVASNIVFVSITMASIVLNAAAKDVPAVLPDPDGKAGDAAKPVKVYILAGQSNLVGYGQLRGASYRYSAVYHLADPDAQPVPGDENRRGPLDRIDGK